jgi:hypothetical protein
MRTYYKVVERQPDGTLLSAVCSITPWCVQYNIGIKTFPKADGCNPWLFVFSNLKKARRFKDYVSSACRSAYTLLVFQCKVGRPLKKREFGGQKTYASPGTWLVDWVELKKEV